MLHHIEFCLDEILCELDELERTLSAIRLEEVRARIDELRALISRLPATGCSADDLTLVRGIDAETAARLAARGIDAFLTIAGWRAADIAGLAAAGITAERVAREGWIEQAAVLATGTLTDFAARVKRGDLACLVAPPAPQAAAAPMVRAEPTSAAPTLIVTSSYLPPVFEASSSAAKTAARAAAPAAPATAGIAASPETSPHSPAAEIAVPVATNVVPLVASKPARAWLRRASLAASLLMLLSVGLLGAFDKLPASGVGQHIVSAD